MLKCDPTECVLPCARLLSCGHSCRKKCNDQCDVTTCRYPCRKLLPCNHRCKKMCNEPCEPAVCVEACAKGLPCEHPCPNKCNEPCITLCEKRVLKDLPCGHQKEIACFSDVKHYKCFQSCLKKLACGHQCKRMCGSAVCTIVCLERIEKEIHECGHKVKVTCHQKAEPRMCREKCKRKLKCGHICPRLCKEECADVCTAIVDKELPDCDHKCKIPCTTDPKTVKCDKPCDKPLPCQHKCVEICSKPCTSQCRVKVRRQHPKCGHYLTLLCHEDIAAKTCRERCRTKLPCSHYCPKMCFEPCKTVDDTSEGRSCEKEDAEKGLFFELYEHLAKTVKMPEKWPICKERVKKTAKCGHQIRCLCYEDPNRIQCQSSCTQLLKCGHQCPGVCSARCDAIQCKVIVLKPIPECDHMIKIECHKDPTSTICQDRCTRKLPCEHPCSKLCSEPCLVSGELCRMKVVRTLPECGHEKQLECHQDPCKELCDRICVKKLSCGHECRKPCHPSWEQCETKCRAKVRKTITKCGHTVRLPCHLDPDSGPYCQQQCTKQLECGHVCKEKCGRPCTTQCKETSNVQKMLPCTHVAREVECYKDPKDVVCGEQCTNRLTCGHDCKNMCGECTHNGGQIGGELILSRCKEVCRQHLLCGHQCQSKCRDCYGGRLHQPCRARVENITLVCGCKVKEMQCCKVLSLRHDHIQLCLLQYRGVRLRRRRLENGTKSKCKHGVSGGYCEEPCTEMLKCKHNCIGICGEPCLKLCRFCNRREVLKIFPEFRAKKDPCYIQLQECGHIFEQNQLKQKLSLVSQTDTCVPILPISCPTCGVSISEKRLNEHTETVASSVQAIERMLSQKASSDERKAEELLSHSKYAHTTRKVTQPIRGGRRGRRPRSRTVSQQVRREGEAHMTWKLRLLNVLDKFTTPTPVFLTSEQQVQRSRCEQNIGECIGDVRKFLETILDEKISLTEQLTEDLACELGRAQCCAGLEQLIIKSRAVVGLHRTDW